MHRYTVLAVLILIVGLGKAQTLKEKGIFSRADTLRGMLSPLRTCYDVNYYHLDIEINPDKRRLSGSTLFRFKAKEDFTKLQFDLFRNLEVDKVVYKGKILPFTREANAVFLSFPQSIKKDSISQFTVFYSGSPTIAKNAPWDGGFVYSEDRSGKPWIAVACQGFGASSWWPNKDHQSDEPDSMLISVTVPSGLMNVSNGRLRSVKTIKEGSRQYNWFVSSPINNYNVTLNIGDYVKFSDHYQGEKGKLDLDYYVLRANLEKAKKHFPGDVKAMLKSFEHWFGPYPFYKDGYKLVETPYLGMEHQSAIAYGNNYMKGYKGSDLSGTGLGLSWDYLIIHESGHEWFGNNITSKDIADMWIHESFTTYSEGLFVESLKGKAAGASYIKGLRKNIGNKTPVIGYYDVNHQGSGDMYAKGANMLHTIRNIIDDDSKWRKILRGLNKTFGLKTTTTEEIVNYINKNSGMDLTSAFDQYLRYPEIPVLEIRKSGDNTIEYRWKTDIPHFKMPVRVKLSDSTKWKTLRATSDWQRIKSSAIKPDTDNFYIKINYLPQDAT
ncbi:M1 family metallopeptidase [Paradesertivirga mongoliensis]|uniref:M1 family metallopeptidase n=1 Tax=Paradesertivirga mongoliensis TaxID=2100740 RepID=A0ABW4ZKB5_9SPHI|nr:M1 family metallopeptidase [Pedobacter mongoliensis]